MLNICYLIYKLRHNYDLNSISIFIMFLLKWSRQDTLEHLKNVLPLNESENYSTTDLSRLPTDPDFRFSASSQTCCGHHMNCGNIFLLTSESMQDFSVCRKSKCHTHTQKFPAWILIQFTKKKEVEKRVSRLDCSKSTFIQSDYIINWLPNSFYSGLFQTHATVLDERPATCPDCHFTILKLAALLVLLWGQVHPLEPDR